jgi:hypothetical protein
VHKKASDTTAIIIEIRKRIIPPEECSINSLERANPN